MAQGDAARIWFPEMLDELKRTWSPDMNWAQMIDFCRHLSPMTQEIRRAKRLKAPLTRCPTCGGHLAVSHRVSVGSVLFTLSYKTSTITATQHQDLNKRWRRFRAKHQLDRYGEPEVLAQGDEITGSPRRTCR